MNKTSIVIIIIIILLIVLFQVLLFVVKTQRKINDKIIKSLTILEKKLEKDEPYELSDEVETITDKTKMKDSSLQNHSDFGKEMIKSIKN